LGFKLLSQQIEIDLRWLKLLGKERTHGHLSVRLGLVQGPCRQLLIEKCLKIKDFQKKAGGLTTRAHVSACITDLSRCFIMKMGQLTTEDTEEHRGISDFRFQL
jgi:hypothetical protein